MQKFSPSEPPFDLECPLMSLPGVFGTAVDTVPWPGAYLGADPKLVEAKWAEFPRVWTEAVPSLRVGFAWAGNPRYKAGRPSDPPNSKRCCRYYVSLGLPGSLCKG